MRQECDAQQQRLVDLLNRVKACEKHVHLYLPYNQFCRTQNYLHLALKGSPSLLQCRNFENAQMQQFITDILADEDVHQEPAKNQYQATNEMEVPPGVTTQKQRQKLVRELLIKEVQGLSREQRVCLIEANERRGQAFYDHEVTNKRQLIIEYEPQLRRMLERKIPPSNHTSNRTPCGIAPLAVEEHSNSIKSSSSGSVASSIDLSELEG